MIWKITGLNLPDMHIRAESFDEALEEARKLDPNYCGGQVVEEENVHSVL